MSLYLNNATQSITADVPPFADLSFNNKRYAVSNELGQPKVFLWSSTSLAISSDDKALSFEDGTVLRFDSIIEEVSDISSDGSSVTVRGEQEPIESMTINDSVLDFTTGSISGAEGSTGITLTLAGFASESEAFSGEIISDQAQVLRIASTKFTLDGNGQYFGFSSRDNISILKFKAVNDYQGGINLSNGYFDFENNGVDKVVIELDNTPYSISSEDDSIQFSKENMIVRFGDLSVPYNFKGKINVIIYVGNDPDGIFMSNHTGRRILMVDYQV